VQHYSEVKDYCEKALECLVNSISLADATNQESGSTVLEGRKTVPGGSWAVAFQDVLRFLTLWFEFGNDAQLDERIKMWKDQIRVEYWLLVIPQLIARIDTPKDKVRNTLKELLKNISVLIVSLRRLDYLQHIVYSIHE